MEKKTGCLLCGKPLIYFQKPQKLTCARCGKMFSARCSCEEGHYICDSCHLKEGVERCFAYCLTCSETVPITILENMLADPFVHMHGPEHHVLVGMTLLVACHNAGMEFDLKSALLQMKTRGESYPDGSCGFWGCCGAAVSAGMAMSILTMASPLSVQPWHQSNEMTARCLAAIAPLGGPRCCKRNSYTAILTAVPYLNEIFSLPIPLPEHAYCVYSSENRECRRLHCPYYHKED